MEENTAQDPEQKKHDAWEMLNESLNAFILESSKTRIRELIAKRVKGCRLETKLTQEEIGNKIGVNPLTYRGYENCKSDIPIVCLVNLADFFEVSMDYLTGRTDIKAMAPKDDLKPASVEERLTRLEKALAELKKT